VAGFARIQPKGRLFSRVPPRVPPTASVRPVGRRRRRMSAR
jgi:hypothetical protein